MKKILIAIHYLELGGAETSLIGLLDSMDLSKVSVDLFVYSHRGELMAAVPSPVNLLPEIAEYAQIERPMTEAFKDGYVKIVAARLMAKWQFGRYCRRTHPADSGAVFSYVFKNVTPFLPPINPDIEYDEAISYLAPHDVVLQKVRAKKKTCWVHTDYTQVDVDTELELPVWSGYDSIVAVSEAVADAFVSRFPSLAGRVEVIPNRISPRLVLGRAAELSEEQVEAEMPRERGVLNLLSVGRFTEAKNFDNVPDICRRLLAEGVKIKWYIIGFGGDEALIESKIQEAEMQRHVIILGKKSNPYPYIKACDCYVQPSRYEGSPMTILEARALGKPVIATAFPTVGSAIEDGVNGQVVPLDNEGCARGMARILKQA